MLQVDLQQPGGLGLSQARWCMEGPALGGRPRQDSSLVVRRQVYLKRCTGQVNPEGYFGVLLQHSLVIFDRALTCNALSRRTPPSSLILRHHLCHRLRISIVS